MRSLWNWARQLVSGSRRREERLPMAMGFMPPNYYRRHLDPPPDYGDADDVLRLLYGDESAASSRPRSWEFESVGLGPLARTVFSQSDTSYIVGGGRWIGLESPRYSSTLGGWTVTTSIDCE